MYTINLLRLGPGASSAGGIFVPTAPIGGSDEWIVCAAAGYKGIQGVIRLGDERNNYMKKDHQLTCTYYLLSTLDLD